MLYALQRHHVDPGREDVYLASVQDQEAALSGYDEFKGRTLLRSQREPGEFWLLDGWSDESAMQMAGATARTLASVAALVEEPDEVLCEGGELARAGPQKVPGGELSPFVLVAESWVKPVCLAEYRETVARLGRELTAREGFRRRLLLADRAQELHVFVLDEWASERAAYESFQRSEASQLDAMRFLSLLSERRRPLLATALRLAV